MAYKSWKSFYMSLYRDWNVSIRRIEFGKVSIGVSIEIGMFEYGV
jgi:hypothetical protein